MAAGLPPGQGGADRRDEPGALEAARRRLELLPAIEDNVGETVSGTKGQLAVKLFGNDLRILDQKAQEVAAAMADVPGTVDLKLFRTLGQPNLEFTIDRREAARFGVNVATSRTRFETTVGGKAVSQVLQGEQRYDVVVRYQEAFRKTRQAIENIRLVAPSGQRVSLGNLPEYRSGTAPTTSIARVIPATTRSRLA